ncbi:hypothetical protein BH11PLA2_BH11PLA2_03880 [soil metagenome]
MTLTQLKDAADHLPNDEREELTNYLVENKPGVMADDIKAEWSAVAHRRLEEMLSGKVQGIPGDEVMREMRERRETRNR